MFDVSGIINLQSDLSIYNPYITVAGQTSPGGILVTGRKVLINTHDVIVQHMRFRVGSHRIADGADPETLDSLNLWGTYWGPNDAYNIIIDHCSISWGVDETFSITGGVTNSTVQWSIVSEGLSQAGHPKGEHSKGLMVSGKYVEPNSVSLHHNYIAHNTDRSPWFYSPEGVDTLVDFTNNVIYNWYHGLGPGGGGSAKMNWVHNYVKAGPDSFAYYEVRDTQESAGTNNYYVFGNMGVSRTDQTDPQWRVGVGWTNTLLSTSYQKATPWDAPPITTTIMSSDESIPLCILSAVGATAPVRDSVDDRVIADFAAGTGSIRDNVTYPDDFPVFATPASPTDADNDGMADTWELSYGIDTTNNDSSLDKDNDGYTNIEEYLHYLSISSFDSNAICMPDVIRVPERPWNLRIK